MSTVWYNIFKMFALEPPSWLFNISTSLHITDFLHLVRQCPCGTPEICLVPVSDECCISGRVIAVVIDNISEDPFIFIVLSSFRVQVFHDSIIICALWYQVSVWNCAGFCDNSGIPITQIHSPVKNSEALY